MYRAMLERTHQALADLEKFIAFSGLLRSQAADARSANSEDANCCGANAAMAAAPDPTSWRIFDHSLAVTRSYALFEAYVSDLLREFLSFLSSNYALQDLGDDFVKKYTKGIGIILSEGHKVKYSALNIPEIVKTAALTFANEKPCSLQPEALLRYEQNLRMTEVGRIFNDCGISNVVEWVNSHSALKGFFAVGGRLSETVDSELKQIVDYRNEASHREIDEVLGTEILIEITQFFSALIAALDEKVQHETIARALSVKQAKACGVVTERYSKGICVAKVSDAELAVGDLVYLHGTRRTTLACIASLQLDDISHEQLKIEGETEVGFALGVPAIVGVHLVQYPLKACPELGVG